MKTVRELLELAASRKDEATVTSILVSYNMGRQHAINGCPAWEGGDPLMDYAYRIGYVAGVNSRAAAAIGEGMK